MGIHLTHCDMLPYLQVPDCVRKIRHKASSKRLALGRLGRPSIVAVRPVGEVVPTGHEDERSLDGLDENENWPRVQLRRRREVRGQAN